MIFLPAIFKALNEILICCLLLHSKLPKSQGLQTTIMDFILHSVGQLISDSCLGQFSCPCKASPAAAASWPGPWQLQHLGWRAVSQASGWLGCVCVQPVSLGSGRVLRAIRQRLHSLLRPRLELGTFPAHYWSEPLSSLFQSHMIIPVWRDRLLLSLLFKWESCPLYLFIF